MSGSTVPEVTIGSLDHLVLTVRDLDATRRFYCDFLGMSYTPFGEGRHALAFGRQKINLHIAGRELEPKANDPVPGSGDLCFLTETPVDTVAARAVAFGVEILEGPVRKTGAMGPIQSVYMRDPDLNLIEVSNQIAGG